tara:strand:+ start:215 stop:472 length:258 start_codon:yes stop_codon:yes gene_type:complete
MLKGGRRKVREGRVISSSMDKTASVQVARTYMHKTFKRVIRRRKNYLVHDNQNELNVGDRVRIIETRPISRNKNWRLLEIIEKSK